MTINLYSFPSDNITLNSLAAQKKIYNKNESVILARKVIKTTNYDDDVSLVLVEKASDGMLIEGLSERYLFKLNKYHGDSCKRDMNLGSY